MTDKPFQIISGITGGCLDGDGSGDHDEPFAGYREYLFNTRQLARLFRVRGDVPRGATGSRSVGIRRVAHPLTGTPPDYLAKLSTSRRRTSKPAP